MKFERTEDGWRSDCGRYEIFPVKHRDGVVTYKPYHFGKPLYGEHMIVEMAQKQCAIDAGER